MPALPAVAPMVAANYPGWDGQDEEEYDEPKSDGEDSIFSAIGQKDTRRPLGETLHLPGPLGRFLGGSKGEIERHEWAFSLRGDAGAGKTRFQYQILNLFAAIGLNCALFSLEIDKNSDLIAKHTKAYIAPANRPRVRIASETPNGLATIEEAAQKFDVVAIDSWGKIPGVKPTDFDVLRKKYPKTLFVVIFQSTTNGTNRGGSSSEFDASAVCHVERPGVARCEKNRYASGAADELGWNVNSQELIEA